MHLGKNTLNSIERISVATKFSHDAWEDNLMEVVRSQLSN